MVLYQLTVNFILFIIGFLGTSINFNSILITIMGIELMLLCSNLNFIMFSIYLENLYGQIFSIFILTIAAAESATGLAILIVAYKLKGHIDMKSISSNKG